MNSRCLLWPAQAGDAGAMGTCPVSVAHTLNVHFHLKREAVRGQQKGEDPGLSLKGHSQLLWQREDDDLGPPPGEATCL